MKQMGHASPDPWPNEPTGGHLVRRLGGLGVRRWRKGNPSARGLFFLSRLLRRFQGTVCCVKSSRLMFGISYGELFLILGATAALIGPKDLPVIARTAGRLAGRAIGYVQLARGQFETVVQQSQANKVHKELQDTIAQLEAIRYEIRSISIMNPGPFTRRLDGPEQVQSTGLDIAAKPDGEKQSIATISKDLTRANSVSSSLHSQAMAYARLAEAPNIKLGSSETREGVMKLNGEGDLLTVLPVSAESAGLLPKHHDESKGSDVLLAAVVEAEVARNAKDFFSQPQNQ
ncbi:hypothetical protein MUK42_36916 [Musa troglodytarum]|uniref:Sec-independent protein translocase protein TatB n=1 Tax=Musa troglodytarum TaxID=320322 RepID=A0A9E7JDH1_9LILI|nr:hypothetical protein MUK42_36916 [Musa troglodytarum]